MFDIYVAQARASALLDILEYDPGLDVWEPKTINMFPNQEGIGISKAAATKARRALIEQWVTDGKRVKGVNYLYPFTRELLHDRFERGEQITNFQEYARHVKAGGAVIVVNRFVKTNQVYLKRQSYRRPLDEAERDIQEGRMYKAVRRFDFPPV